MRIYSTTNCYSYASLFIQVFFPPDSLYTVEDPALEANRLVNLPNTATLQSSCNGKHILNLCGKLTIRKSLLKIMHHLKYKFAWHDHTRIILSRPEGRGY